MSSHQDLPVQRAEHLFVVCTKWSHMWGAWCQTVPWATFIALVCALFLSALTMTVNAEEDITLLNEPAVTAPQKNTPNTAAAQSLGTWRYSVLPEDTIWSISNAYLAEEYSWVELIRFNNLQRANQVKPGSTLLIPFSWMKLQPAPAIAISVSGETLLKRSQQSNWVNLEEDFYLHVGDTIKTFKGSVLVKFADDSVLRLEEDTVLIFNRLTQFGKSGMTDTGLRLEKGRVSTKVTPNRQNGSRYEISTPSAVAAVRGTEFRVDADTRGTDLEVVEGVVEFSIRDKKLDVPAGYSVSATQGEGLSTPAKLLVAPAAGDLPAQTETLPISLSWGTVKGAASYRYSVYADTLNGKQELTGTNSTPSFQIGYLPNGNYTITMRAVAASGSEGLDAQHLLHIGITAKPAILVSPLPDQIFSRVQPTFRWSDSQQSQKARLEIAENREFDPVIIESDYIQSSYTNLDFILPPGQYFWRVRTVAGSDSDALSDVRSVGIRGTLPEGEIISVNYNDDKVKVFWKTIPGALSYVVQLADTEDFSKIIREESSTEPNISLRLQKATTYYIRVKGVGSHLFTSEFGPEKELRLLDPK